MKYHLIGIGGTGMGALAGLLHAAGHDVRGSDSALYPPMSDQLAALGIPVFVGYAADNLTWTDTTDDTTDGPATTKPDVVVVGNVCRRDHVEVQEAQRQGLPLTSLPALLGEGFLEGKRSVVVAGTHGKTTTTSLISYLLLSAGRDPGVFVGGVPLNMGRGYRFGHGSEFVVEGDEYDSAFFDKGPKFLHYRPRIAVLTSVELDHVDIYSSMESVRQAFARFVALLPEDGLLIVCATASEAVAIAREHARCRVETYAVREVGLENGASEAVAAPVPQSITDAATDAVANITWVADNLDYTKSGRCRFELSRGGHFFNRFESLLIGRHNIANAAAAIAVAHAVGLTPEEIAAGLASFAGVKRRQEVRGIAQGVYVLDDYAHHPTAVEETLRALRKRFRSRRLIAVFEPRSATSRRHTFQREYAIALAHADVVVVGRLHDPSGIPPEERLDPERLALELHNKSGTLASYIANTEDIVSYLMGLWRPGDVIAILSSGAFDGLHDKLLAALGDAVRWATANDMSDIRSLAGQLGWSLERASDQDAGMYLVLHNETGFVGCVGLEVYGDAGILHSLAVKKQARGVGYGWLLADTVVQTARHRGVRRIYLMTEDASDFFAAKLGFRVIDVSTVSPAVAGSSVFRAQSDKGATAMRLDL